MRAGIEAGGTKVVCAVGTGPHDIRGRTVIPTTTPEETLGRVVAFLEGHPGIEAIGVASFGPLDLRPDSPSYGTVTTTPKPGWAGTDLMAPLRQAFGVPLALDTDVNGAAYGESRWGATQGMRSSAYLTVGTGIGGGAVVAGRTVSGLLHPEMGHVHAQRHPRDTYDGFCPFHGDCLEGLAAGPAVQARFGRAAQDLDGDDLVVAVEMESWYLAQLVSSVVYVLSPQRVVLGGGVLGVPGLLPAIREALLARMAGAIAVPELGPGVTGYLVPPGLGSSSGVLGALAMADDLLQ